MPPNVDQWLSLAVLAALSGCGMLTTVFTFLYVQYREGHVRTWAWGWAFQFLHFLIFLLRVLGWRSDFTQPLLDLSLLASGLLLLAGTGQLVQRKFTPTAVGCGVAGCLWIIFCTQVKLPAWQEMLPLFFFLSGVSIWTGLLFLRMARRTERSARFTGWALILWGLHKADAPFLRQLEWFAPWGFLFGGVLAFVVALGMLLTYFQRVREALLRSEDRFRAIST